MTTVASPTSTLVAARDPSASCPPLPADGRVARLTFGLVLRDLVRNRWLLSYGLGLALLTVLLLRLGGGGLRVVASLVNIVLLATPLVSAIFATTYWHAAQDLVLLLLGQPVRRGAVFAGLAAGIAVPLAATGAAALLLPLLAQRAIDGETGAAVATLVGVAVALTGVFTAIGLLTALWSADRLRALAAALGVWGVLAVGYDAAVLALTTRFAEYPLERPLLALSLANPIDLGRILLLLRVDRPMLQGYTGAVFEQFFGAGGGMLLAAGILCAWIIVPLTAAARQFTRRDF